MVDNLIPDFEQTDTNALEDLLLIMAKNVESALVQSEAKPRLQIA